MSNKLFWGLSAAGGAYGAVLGASQTPYTPRSEAEARRGSSYGHLGLEIARDTAIAFADDAVAFAALPLLRTRFKGATGLFNAALGAMAFGGTAIAGAIAARDVRNFMTARDYLERRDQNMPSSPLLEISQSMVPDFRLNAIDGFSKTGANARYRRATFGIASPAAGGIFYRMFNNPFAQHVRAITDPSSPQASDPAFRALGYSYVGGAAGWFLGMRGGFGKGTKLGLLGGVAGGLYGIASAHNPDWGRNLSALTQIAVGVGPTVAAGGALYGLSRSRLAGGAVRTGLNWMTNQAGRAGAWITAQEPLARAGHARMGLNIARAGVWAERGVRGASVGVAAHTGAAYSSLGLATGRWGPLSSAQLGIWQQNLANAGSRTVTVATKAVHAASTGTYGLGNVFIHEGLAPMLTETGKATNKWEQSLGIGHLLTMLPHQVLVGQQAVSITHRSLSTSTMPSNRARA